MGARHEFFQLWKELDLKHLLLAMDECDRYGTWAFRQAYGFRSATDPHMFFKYRGPYEARPLVAAAYLKFTGGAILLEPANMPHDSAHDFLIKQYQFKKDGPA